MKSPNRIHFVRSIIAFPAVVIVCLVALTFVATVNAGPEPKSGPMVSLTRTFDWSGFYIGGNLGGMLTDYDFGPFEEEVNVTHQLGDAISLFDSLGVGSQSDAIAFFSIPERHETTDGSVIGGGQIGFQKQFGHFVLGVEGDIDRASSSASSRTSFSDPVIVNIFESESDPDVDFNASTLLTAIRKSEINWTASARGRVGYAHGALLIYGTGGVAWANVRTWADDRAKSVFFLDIDDEERPAGGDDGDANELEGDFVGRLTTQNISRNEETRVGWTAGGGIELAVSDAYTIGLEYRHSDFGSDTVHFNSHGGPISPGSTKVDIVNDQVTLRCNVLFSHFFGSQNYAGTNASVEGGPENMSVAYTTAPAGSEQLSAKDKNVAVVPVEEPFSWTGFYLGGNVGGNWTEYDFGGYDQEVDLDQQFDERGGLGRPESRPPPEFGFASFGFNGGSGSSSGSGSGLHDDAGSDASILGGGQIGFQKQWGRFVAGVEGDFGGTNASQSVNFEASAITPEMGEFGFSDYAVTNVLSRRSVAETWRASARARFGYVGGPGGKVLLYVTGGGVWSNVKVWAVDSAETDFFQTQPSNDQVIMLGTSVDRARSKDGSIQGGWTAGGGAEWALTKIASIGLEYRHNEFSDDTYHFDGHHTAISPGSTKIDLDGDQVTFKVNILLGNAGR